MSTSGSRIRAMSPRDMQCSSHCLVIDLREVSREESPSSITSKHLKKSLSSQAAQRKNASLQKKVIENQLLADILILIWPQNRNKFFPENHQQTVRKNELSETKKKTLIF